MKKEYNLPIETERLIIRKWREEDFQSYNFLCQESIRGHFFDGWAMEEDDAKNFFHWQLSKYENMDPIGDIIGLAIIEKSTGKIVGHGGIGKHDDVDETEIFYGIVKAYRGKGYATEASRGITSWALDTFSIPYIIGTVGLDNIESQKVLERSGYNFIEEQNHNVSVLEKSFDFKYYRCYGSK
ncbi:GNAT family N-acetyltransferase [Oceanirhabdus sp. W0125-5]|uniref:GNAT family N-acetyltransferase n=1 Tax=Oceanirhabdus sp. W0125-5 TaxID=2999116 RepID=UPI0022F2B31D|nr:GNAT family N-acetyltransferase [Oceanirhabdus sp. W0125-5]WBW95634.1 GNAT family N-acetyltransferase [Oceanirhabdus sp. W0125-5]